MTQCNWRSSSNPGVLFLKEWKEKIEFWFCNNFSKIDDWELNFCILLSLKIWLSFVEIIGRYPILSRFVSAWVKNTILQGICCIQLLWLFSPFFLALNVSTLLPRLLFLGFCSYLIPFFTSTFMASHILPMYISFLSVLIFCSFSRGT